MSTLLNGRSGSLLSDQLLSPGGSQKTANNQLWDATNEAIDYMDWAAQQAAAVSRIKIFHQLAKQINDQQ